LNSGLKSNTLYGENFRSVVHLAKVEFHIANLLYGSLVTFSPHVFYPDSVKL